jgi:chorismate-pyruvate lyase
MPPQNGDDPMKMASQLSARLEESVIDDEPFEVSSGDNSNSTLSSRYQHQHHNNNMLLTTMFAFVLFLHSPIIGITADTNTS